MTKPIDKKDILSYLDKNYLEFKNKYHIESIGLFGSYARDEENKDSDIDIFVKMKPSLFGIVAIKEQIENDLDKKVDIIREHKNIKPFLLKKIKEDLIYIFSN